MRLPRRDLRTRLFAPIFLDLATGLRRGELLALRWTDIDFETGALTVNQALEQTKAGLDFKAPKTKRSRRKIALSPSAVETLRTHLVNQMKERMALGLGRDAGGLVFAQHDGQPISPMSFSQAYRRMVKRAGIKKVTFHSLRHSHATELLRVGVHPKVAQERLGHASIATTLDLYSHIMPGMQEDAALKIDGALRTALEQS